MAPHETNHWGRRPFVVFKALDKVNKAPICVEPRPSKSCLKTANIYAEPKSCLLVSTVYNTFSYQNFPHKTPTELPKHVHFRLTSDNPIHAKRPSSFPEFNLGFTYVWGFNPSEKLLYQIAIPTTKQPELNDTSPWSDKCTNELYEVAPKLSEDQEDKMDTGEPYVTVTRPFMY